MAAAALALLAANSPLSHWYETLLAMPAEVRVGPLELAKPLLLWINDGLMALFFFVVGLEIRRELDMGELRDRRRVAVPVLAAVGGMAVPALIYVSFTAGTDAVHGWGIVMATDTAFALGVLALVGRRWPVRLRVFVLTLVVVDNVEALTTNGDRNGIDYLVHQVALTNDSGTTAATPAASSGPSIDPSIRAAITSVIASWVPTGSV
jgi:NhaA family Na+:H+ antiporter